MSITDTEKKSKELINNLAIAIKTAQIHHIDNVSIDKAINKILYALSFLASKDFVTLELVGEFFYIDGNRIRYSMDYIFNYDFLVREFKKRELGTIIFDDNTSEKDIRALLLSLINIGFSETPLETLQESIKDIKNISIKKLKHIDSSDTAIDRKKIIKKGYFSAALLTRNMSTKVASGEKINLKQAKRVMEGMVNNVIEDESMLIGMTTIKDYDDYTYFHSVNVSILSIALGHRLGLDKKRLTELGLAGILHDIGKVEVPKEILDKPVEFTAEDWQVIMKHPAWGAIAIFKMRGLDVISMNPFISAFEHHLNFDLSGYPKLKHQTRLNLFSRIISIADQYDAMTSSRVYSRIPIPPEKTLSIIVDRSGTQLDPCLAKVFINMVGIYPIGSLVMLDTNELGLVFESNTNPEFSIRPRVMVVIDSNGEKINKTVDLMEKDNDGKYKRSIVKTLDPNQYKINLAEYLL